MVALSISSYFVQPDYEDYGIGAPSNVRCLWDVVLNFRPQGMRHHFGRNRVVMGNVG